MKIDRRNMLRGVGSAALAASLTQMFNMHRSRAQAAGATTKVVFFYTPCGVQVDLWHPSETGTTFNLKELSAPLEPHKKDAIFMDGVAMYPLSDHQGGSQQMLAGDDQDVKTMDLQLGDMLTDGIVTGWRETAAGHLARDIRSLAGYALGELPDDPAADDAKPEPVAIRTPPRPSTARKPGRS